MQSSIVNLGCVVTQQTNGFFTSQDFLPHEFSQASTYAGVYKILSYKKYYLRNQFRFKIYQMDGNPLGASFNNNYNYVTYQNYDQSVTDASTNTNFNFALLYDPSQMSGQTFFNLFNNKNDANCQNVIPSYSAILDSNTALQANFNPTSQKSPYTYKGFPGVPGSNYNMRDLEGKAPNVNKTISSSVNYNGVANYYLDLIPTTIQSIDFKGAFKNSGDPLFKRLLKFF